jgi:predicted nucleic acid-binding protein
MKIFWDTNLFIYLWEDSPWREKTRDFMRCIIAREHVVVTSSLSVAEILVQPIKSGQPRARAAYLEAFRSLQIVPFDLQAAEVFAELRAAHPGLRPPDAIQLACASIAGCETFVTNDERLAAIHAPLIGRIGTLRNWRELVG